MAHTHTHIHTMGHYLTIKKNEIMPSVLTWMGLEIIGQSKPETERQYHMILLICGIFQKRIQQNLFSRQKETQRYGREIYGYKKGKRGGRTIWNLRLTDIHCYIQNRASLNSSAGKESSCSAGDPGSIPGFDSWLVHWRRDRLPTPVFLGFPGGSSGKETTCNAGDLGSIPGLGRSPGEGKGQPLQYSVCMYMCIHIHTHPTQGWNPGLLHCRPILYHLSHIAAYSLGMKYSSFSAWLYTHEVFSPLYSITFSLSTQS